MKPEDKELLLKDLCARLPYGVKVQYNGSSIRLIQAIGKEGNEPYFKSKEVAGWLDVGSCKPYLRPMSSMTEEERKIQKGYIYHFLKNSLPDYEGDFVFEDEAHEYIDWLNKKMLDFRGLIDKDLAIEVTEENNPY